MKILCVIAARGGSKGVAGKNIKPLLGKPLIGWSIEQAQQCSLIDRVVVSTDSQKIAEIAKEFKAEIPFLRPKELASDNSGKWQVWQHALNKCEEFYKESYDIYLDLDCTSPLRDIEDIYKAIDFYKKNSCDAVFSICEARRNPYFNMVEYDESQRLKVVIKREIPILCRQNAPKVYDHVGTQVSYNKCLQLF
tara:strand:- start:28 stop:606 length:579 start_codon:yes stop_codon:yes gene_type:complete